MTHKRASTPLKLDKRKALLEALKRGNYIETAAALAGVPRGTLYDLLKTGRQDIDDGNLTTSLAKLVFEVEEAQATAEKRDLLTIEQASGQQWQAAAWRLERRYPERWGKRERVEHSGSTTVDVNVDITSAKEELAARLAAIAQRRQTPVPELEGSTDE